MTPFFASIAAEQLKLSKRNNTQIGTYDMVYLTAIG